MYLFIAVTVSTELYISTNNHPNLGNRKIFTAAVASDFTALIVKVFTAAVASVFTASIVKVFTAVKVNTFTAVTVYCNQLCRVQIQNVVISPYRGNKQSLL